MRASCHPPLEPFLALQVMTVIDRVSGVRGRKMPRSSSTTPRQDAEAEAVPANAKYTARAAAAGSQYGKHEDAHL